MWRSRLVQPVLSSVKLNVVLPQQCVPDTATLIIERPSGEELTLALYWSEIETCS